MDFNPLHEPGQGNQGLRACNGYRYEFHIGKGTSLKDEVVYRVEFTNRLEPEARPSRDGPARRRQRAALAAHRRHRDDEGHAHRRDDDDRTTTATGRRRRRRRSRQESPGPAEQPRPADRSARLRPRPLQGLRLRRSHQPRSRVSTISRSSTPSSIRCRNGGRIIAGQFDDPYQLDEKGIFDLVNLNIERPRRHPRRAPAAGQGRVHRLQRLLDRPRSPDRATSSRTASRTTARSSRTRPTACSASGRASAASETQTVDPSNIITGLKGSGDWVQVGRNALPLFNAGLVGTQRQTLYLHTSPMNDVTNFGADILFPVLVRDAEALGIYKALGVPPATVATLKGPRAGHHQRHQPGPADPGRRRLHRRRHHARRGHRFELPERPPPRRRHRAEPQSGEREQRADQPDRRGRPGGRPRQRRRGQRQGLSRPVPVPGARPPGSAPGTRRHQRADGAEHPDSVVASRRVDGSAGRGRPRRARDRRFGSEDIMMTPSMSSSTLRRRRAARRRGRRL